MNLRDEQLWYYRVPDEYIFFTKAEECFLGNDDNWVQFDFCRPTKTPKFWKEGMPRDAFSIDTYVTDFLWQLRGQNETIKIKSLDQERVICRSECRSKERLLYVIRPFTIDGDYCCIQFWQEAQLVINIFFEPGELMHIYLRKHAIPRITEHLSRYGKETDYHAYQLDELDSFQ